MVSNKICKKHMTCLKLLPLLESRARSTNLLEARMLIICPHLKSSRNRLSASKSMKTSSPPFHLACSLWLSRALKQQQNEKLIGAKENMLKYFAESGLNNEYEFFLNIKSPVPQQHSSPSKSTLEYAILHPVQLLNHHSFQMDWLVYRCTLEDSQVLLCRVPCKI